MHETKHAALANVGPIQKKGARLERLACIRRETLESFGSRLGEKLRVGGDLAAKDLLHRRVTVVERLERKREVVAGMGDVLRVYFVYFCS